jgi:hypothetical protein
LFSHVRRGAGGFRAANLHSRLKPFIAVDDPVIALEHVRVIDVTGAPPVEDQTIVIDHGRIQSVGPSDRAQEVAEKSLTGQRPVPRGHPSHWSAVVGQVADTGGRRFLPAPSHSDRHLLRSGKRADLVVLEGNPVREVADIEKVTLVFKDGVGFDSAELIQSVHGHVGMN